MKYESATLLTIESTFTCLQGHFFRKTIVGRRDSQ